jgi:hypothetical protein
MPTPRRWTVCLLTVAATAALAAPVPAQNPAQLTPPPRPVAGVPHAYSQPQFNTGPYRTVPGVGGGAYPVVRAAGYGYNPGVYPAAYSAANLGANPAAFVPNNPLFNPVVLRAGFNPLLVARPQPVFNGVAANPAFNPGTLNPALAQPAAVNPLGGVAFLPDATAPFRLPGPAFDPQGGVIIRPGLSGFLPWMW